ncbi:hypothetical protein SAMN05216262_13122 [Colwellia chukchiensis]|uniref:Uncharacterized protein n=1 Tax=Colwellia chukchiensis TaxID=641665 RepID=A0A1H7U0M8_9GAMM|nr:hypothetical protein [Colwellia chukchiensis]SEL90339.1 hypothetical protein SAMN05216262_13122 [Colwellia chukchiensis]
MSLAKQLQKIAQKRYPDIVIHPELKIEDRYIFISNRFLKELHGIKQADGKKAEIINIEYDEKTGIPTFVLIANSIDLDSFLDRWHFEFMCLYIQGVFK